MSFRITAVGLIALAAACSEAPTEPHNIIAPSGRGPSRSVVAGAPIVLGSGITSIGSRDPSNQLVACTGPACPSGSLPQDAFIVPKHPAYATPLAGTKYIASVFDGTTIAAPGYACCSTATFENAFTLPPNATDATITISFFADNMAIGEINGVEIGRQLITVDNFGGPTPQTFTLHFTPASGGTNRLHVSLVDGGGALGLDYLATVTYSLVTDETPPVITPTVTGTLGNNGWYTSDVSVSWAVSDPDSPVSSTTGCDAASITADTPGSTFTCAATSGGGSASNSTTVKRDATAPVVSYAGNVGSYSVDQTVSITCSASDALSGVASSTCANVSGAAYSFAIGANSFSASATDNAGNVGSGSASFTVTVGSGSLCTLVRRWVSQNGIANSMCQQLNNGAYDAFRNHVSAQSGKAVSADNAAILISLSRSL